MSFGALPITKVIVLERISGCFPVLGEYSGTVFRLASRWEQAQDATIQRIFKEKQHMPLFGSRMPLESLGGALWHIVAKRPLKRLLIAFLDLVRRLPRPSPTFQSPTNFLTLYHKATQTTAAK